MSSEQSVNVECAFLLLSSSHQSNLSSWHPSRQYLSHLRWVKIVPFFDISTIKLGGLSFLSSFQDDLYGGLRLNLPGKKEFLLPEYWQGCRVSCYAADIWAAVVSLYVLIKGIDPFPIKHLDEHIERMSNYSVIPKLDGFSEELHSLLESCMSPKMAMRPTINQILVEPRGNCDFVAILVVQKIRLFRRSELVREWMEWNVVSVPAAKWSLQSPQTRRGSLRNGRVQTCFHYK